LAFFEHGYVHVEGLLDQAWLERLHTALADVIEQSRGVTASDDQYVLEPGHTAHAPRLRRMNRAADHHPTFWEYASAPNSILPDLVADLVGPNVKFREAMLNFKWCRGGDAVSWHQDLPFYPHTNTTPLVALTCFEDVDSTQGPLMVIPGSHRGGLLDHYDTDGRWRGCVSDVDLQQLPIDKAVSLTGPAGSVTILHGFMLHASRRNDSEKIRPLLLCGYSAADAFSYTPIPLASKYLWTIVRGERALYARHEPGRFKVPPDWSKGYTSLYETQQRKERAAN
jgi:ectoine hydroxylase-related dioxygenase (phytanoyl-CoA dioxygenase family)